MKKILSAVLAAAMVLSMGVMAFAEVTFGGGTATKKDLPANFSWGDAYLERDGKITNYQKSTVKLQPNDVLFFATNYKDDTYHAVPSNWKIKISNADYIEGAEFHIVDTRKEDGHFIVKDNSGTLQNPTSVVDGRVFVKVEISDFDEFESANVNFYFYVYDGKNSSDKVTVKYKLDNYGKDLFENELDWVIVVDGPVAYKYDSKAKAKEATFDFNGSAFVEVKLFPGETYNLNSNTKYNKDIARLYPEADFDFVELHGDFDKAADVVIPASKDNKFIYEVVDGDLVAVDAEYVKGHKFANGEKVNGYLFTTNELGKYAISDVELDLEDEDIDLDDDTTSAPVEDNKVNPPMGANDFVGAAVALAVVSVAAAGALALKK